MSVPARYILAALTLMVPGVAGAECCGASPTPTLPPIVEPSAPGCAMGCSTRTFTPDISVSQPHIVTPSLAVAAPSVAVAQASSSATTLTTASASAYGGVGSSAGGRSDAFAAVYGGGAGGWFGYFGGVDSAGDTLGGGAEVLGMASEAQSASAKGLSLASSAPSYADSRTAVRESLIEAVCIDARGVRHPALQTFSGRAVAADFSGEIFRCAAGMRMDVSMSDAQRGAAAGSQGFSCHVDEALAYDRFKLQCRPRKSLTRVTEASLGRFGAGAKLASVYVVEAARIGARREAAGTQVTTGHMAMDGGVGQSVW